jgi:hypothetical protein
LYKMKLLLELPLEKRKRRVREESTNHVNSYLICKIRILYSST